MDKDTVITYMVKHPQRVLDRIDKSKNYVVAAELGISPATLSQITPVLKEIIKQYHTSNDHSIDDSNDQSTEQSLLG